MAIAHEPPPIDLPDDLPGADLVPPRLETFEEFLGWITEHDVRAEWVDGEVTLLLPAAAVHQYILVFLAWLFRTWIGFHAPGGRLLVAPFQMRLADPRPGRKGSVREPDLIYVAPEHAGRVQSTRLEGPADIAVEIISPESRHRDRETKYREYERAGIREYWLIDPENEEVLFYRLDDTGAYRRVPLVDGVFESAVLPGFRFEVAWLWQEPLPLGPEVLRAWKLIA